MTDSLLTTKLYIPSSRPELVPRPRLIEQLNDGLHHALTLISAPAGFGKTTLVTEWVDNLRQDLTKESAPQKKIVWLSLDESDNDLPRFLTYFINALKQGAGANNNLGRTALSMLQNPQLPPTEMILTPVINDISSTINKMIFVLDDFHLMESQPIHKALNFWLENAPPQVHTVIITREDPRLPLTRLRARDQLTELRAADLRFTEQEAAQFLNDIMGLRLDAESVAALRDRTEGWITGLQMAALSMRNRKDVHGFIQGFSGTNRYILDYLLEEVLASQPPKIQRFLLKTSILRRLTAPLCDEVLAADEEIITTDEDRSALSKPHLFGQSKSILEYLERTNIFLIPLDDERIWYRYHHLFADLLRARLQETHTRDELSALHTRAAQWFEKNEMPYAAIYHASLVPNNEWVERLIEQNYMEIFQRSDSGSIRHWTGDLSMELIYKRPLLSIHEAMSRSWLGQLDDADLLLNEAEKRLQIDNPTPETKALTGHLLYVRSRITGMRGEFRQAIQLCLTARENTPPSNLGLLGGIGVMLGYGYFLEGDFTNAAKTLTETIQSGKISGAINTTIGAYCVLARLYALQGPLPNSYDLYQEAKKFIQSSDGQHQGAMSIVDVGTAEVLYEWNDLEAALTHIHQGLEFIPLWSKADDIALAYTTYSRIQQAQENTTAALETIEKGSQVIQSSGVFSEARDAVLAAKTRLQLVQENNLAINRTVSSLENRLSAEDPFRFENEIALITLARLYMAQKKLNECHHLLSKLEENAQTRGRMGRLIEIIILRSLAAQRWGKSDQALSILNKGLILAEPEGYVRIFADEGEPMHRLISEWLALSGDSPLRLYAQHLLSQFDTKPNLAPAVPDKSSAQEGLIEPLSPREIEVLEHIAQGKTNKEIARLLVVSPGTVKAHTSSIYRKLDVANRTEAVARARQLDLLP